MSRVNRSARSDTSVATTSATSRRARSAWMPHPEPMSSPRPTGVGSCSAGEGERGAADAEDVVLGERSAQGGLIEVARDPPLPRTAVVGERLRADDAPAA